MILCRKTRGSFNDGASVHEKTTAQDKLRRKGANARQGTTLALFRLADNKGAKLFIEKPSQRLTAAHSGTKAFEFSSPQLFPFAVGLQAHTKFTLRCYTPQSVLPKQNGTKRRCRVTAQAQKAQTFALWEVYAPQHFSKQKSVFGRFFCRENFDCVTKNTIRIEFLLA